MLSASANKLSRLKEQAEEYAALIMEELDPERLGYIEVGEPLFALINYSLLQVKYVCMIIYKQAPSYSFDKYL